MKRNNGLKIKETSILERNEKKVLNDMTERGEEEQSGSMAGYDDELDDLSNYRLAIDNYFNQGRLKPLHKTNRARRKK